MANEEKKLYRVRPGRQHGAQNQYGPGDTRLLTEREAAPLLDILEPVDGDGEEAAVAESGPAENPPTATEEAVDTMTVNDVIAAVSAGDLDRDQALAAERSGKNRSTLIEALEGMI